MPSILIADDNAVVRQGLKMVLEREIPLALIGEAQNSDEVLREVTARSWDLVLLDLSMPGKGGLEVLADMKLVRPKQNVLILSMYPEDQLAVRAIRAGACGYVAKDSDRTEFIRAVHIGLRGGRYISSALAESIAAGITNISEPPLHLALSNREYEIMRAIASGKSLGEIAKERALSPKTVSTYRKRILEKLHMNSNAELVRYVAEKDLL